jgi:antitoxin (DNA-binding transcriptional repressor) of toxin-antitoxin stability system
MIVMPVGEFKARFSDVLQMVEQKGQEIVISYGKRKRKIAAIIPYTALKKRTNRRKLGVLRGRCGFEIKPDFKMSDEELLNA